MEAGSAAPEPSGVELSIDRRELRQARTAALPTRHEIAWIERSAIAERLAHSLTRVSRSHLLTTRIGSGVFRCSARAQLLTAAHPAHADAASVNAQPSTKGWRNPRTCCVLCGRNSSPLHVSFKAASRAQTQSPRKVASRHENSEQAIKRNKTTANKLPCEKELAGKT